MVRVKNFKRAQTALEYIILFGVLFIAVSGILFAYIKGEKQKLLEDYITGVK